MQKNDYVAGISQPTREATQSSNPLFFSILKCSMGDRCATISSLIPLQQCNHSLDYTFICDYRPNRHDP